MGQERGRGAATIGELCRALEDTLAFVAGYAASAEAEDPVHEMLPRYAALLREARAAAAAVVTVTIPRGRAVLLLRLARREARARRARAARSGFVPEPGRMNADQATAASLDAVAEALCDALRWR